MNKKRVGLTVLALLGAVLIGGTLWMTTSYAPQEQARLAMEKDEDVVVLDMGNYITFTPVAGAKEKGFIFYPGAKVQPEAYAPLARAIAEEGYQAAIVQMPLNFAILGTNRGQEVIDDYPAIDTWVIGGHSLGGVSAAQFAAENEEVEGLVLLASYPMDDRLREMDKDVISIWGTSDGVLDQARLEASKGQLPKSTQYIPLEGGNHAQFGDYGKQSGDEPATCSPEEQLTHTVEAVLTLLNPITE